MAFLPSPVLLDRRSLPAQTSVDTDFIESNAVQLFPLKWDNKYFLIPHCVHSAVLCFRGKKLETEIIFVLKELTLYHHKEDKYLNN